MAGRCPEKGWVSFLGQLEQSGVEHLVEERFDDRLTVGRYGALIAGSLLPIDADAREGGLLVRSYGEQRLVVIGHGVLNAFAWIRSRGDAGEVLLDQSPDVRGVEVTHRDHGHEVGPVPVAVESLRDLVVEGFEDLLLPDGQALGVV